jgi:hypothetical protein
LLSKGENYGHATLESLAQVPPLIIYKYIHGKLAVHQPCCEVSVNQLSRPTQTLIDMDCETYQNWSKGTKNYHEREIKGEQKI